MQFPKNIFFVAHRLNRPSSDGLFSFFVVCYTEKHFLLLLLDKQSA